MSDRENQSSPDDTIAPPVESLDAALDKALSIFKQTHRLDHAHDQMHRSLRARLIEEGYTNGQLQLLEVNLFGSLSGWMRFIIEEYQSGRNAVPDFAGHLRRTFMTHCKDAEIEPETAVNMALELANALMEVAVGYRRHLGLSENRDTDG